MPSQHNLLASFRLPPWSVVVFLGAARASACLHAAAAADDDDDDHLDGLLWSI